MNENYAQDCEAQRPAQGQAAMPNCAGREKCVTEMTREELEQHATRLRINSDLGARVRNSQIEVLSAYAAALSMSMDLSAQLMRLRHASNALRDEEIRRDNRLRHPA